MVLCLFSSRMGLTFLKRLALCFLTTEMVARRETVREQPQGNVEPGGKSPYYEYVFDSKHGDSPVKGGRPY